MDTTMTPENNKYIDSERDDIQTLPGGPRRQPHCWHLVKKKYLVAAIIVLFVLVIALIIVVATMDSTRDSPLTDASEDIQTPMNTPPETMKIRQPNVVFVLVDDLGYGDVSYHGGSQIKTPIIDQLSADGVRLENYYVQPSCSPTRSQLMTGRYQIHTGLSHGIIKPMQPKAVPLDEVLLPQKLKESGYSCHMVGKWHLGHYKKEFMPHFRGFDTFYGMLLGAGDHFFHNREFIVQPKSRRRVHGVLTRNKFVDLRDNCGPIRNESGHYSTHLFTQKAVDVIKVQSNKKPFFLYVSYQAVHGPLQVPRHYLRMNSHIRGGKHRRRLAGMVTALDEGGDNITKALKDKGLWENTVFIFSTDNGSGRPGYYNNGPNWPLRGGKVSMFEGGIRAVGFVSGGFLKRKGVVHHELMHVSDWFPTIVRLAGGNLDGGKPLDGYDQWPTISTEAQSPRKVLLHNIDILARKRGAPVFNDTFDTSVRAALRVGEMKVMTGSQGSYKHWTSPSDGQNYTIRVDEDQPDKNLWLFNLTSDPFETSDLSTRMPELVRSMLDLLVKFNDTAVVPFHPPNDPNSDPRLLDGAWGPWL